MRNTVVSALLLVAASASSAQEMGSRQLEFMVGNWILHDQTGKVVGQSRVEAQVPGTMLFEQRIVGDRAPQSLWFEYAERNKGWTQLFVGPEGMTREFTPRSAHGVWPMVLGAAVTLQDGTPARFRMTIARASDEKYQRLLEISRDDGKSWQTVFDYAYRRAGPGKDGSK